MKPALKHLQLPVQKPETAKPELIQGIKPKSEIGRHRFSLQGRSVPPGRNVKVVLPVGHIESIGQAFDTERVRRTRRRQAKLHRAPWRRLTFSKIWIYHCPDKGQDRIG